MPAPEILAFGDGDHEAGETGLTIDGGGFGAFPGSAWIYENANRTGDADELTIAAWNDIELSGVEIPGSPNNATGTRYLFVQREDLAWSQGFSFTLGQVVIDALIIDSLQLLPALTLESASLAHVLSVDSISVVPL